ncbi:MAG: chemotaxis protein CheW [Gammaproteobacteria bacterium]|nr:chemotaxis protein CheW [Gammaproteobacteria bacterium]
MNATGPFSTLASLALKSQLTARALPAKEDAQAYWTGLGVCLLGQRLVVPLDDITEMMRIPQVTRLPGVRSFVAGVANVRGRLMALVDLARFLGGEASVARSLRCVLVVEADEHYFGFVVDESLGMQHFLADSFTTNVGSVDARIEPYLDGSYQVAGMVWPVLSLGRLREDPGLEKLS